MAQHFSRSPARHTMPENIYLNSKVPCTAFGILIVFLRMENFRSADPCEFSFRYLPSLGFCTTYISKMIPNIHFGNILFNLHSLDYGQLFLCHIFNSLYMILVITVSFKCHLIKSANSFASITVNSLSFIIWL